MKKVILLSLAVCLFAAACNKNDLEFTKDGLPTNCAPNEIIYKTQYGYPIELKIGEESYNGVNYDDFGGAVLVANLCEDGYCKYIFDADITKIPHCGFSGRVSLISMIIPSRVTSIGDYAFSGCSSLTSVTIPDSVTSIGEFAFYDCWSLTSVYCKPTTPPAGDDYMFSCYAYYGYKPIGCKIYVPTASVDAYKSAEYWSNYASDIEGYDF